MPQAQTIQKNKNNKKLLDIVKDCIGGKNNFQIRMYSTFCCSVSNKNNLNCPYVNKDSRAYIGKEEYYLCEKR